MAKMGDRVCKDVRLEVGESFPSKFGRVTHMCKLIKVWDWNGELHKRLPVLVFEISDSQDKRGAPATCPWNETQLFPPRFFCIESPWNHARFAVISVAHWKKKGGRSFRRGWSNENFIFVSCKFFFCCNNYTRHEYFHVCHFDLIFFFFK